MTDLQGHVSRDENGETRTGSVVAGRYRLLERLGAGGFGRVWRARDEKLGVEVAIKEVWLPPAMSAEAHAERVLRAEREARNAARLRDHPNVVAVHDVVVDGGVPWTVMQLIEGKTLEEHVEAHGALSVDNGARVARAMLKALGAAHAAGIVHRDVKPANVMLTTDHEVVLTDFGIAQQQADTSLTQTGTLIGSLEYVAPERLRGEEGQGISDLFSLGVTLYHAMEGFSPFHRDTATGVMTAVLFEAAPAPRNAGTLTPLIMGLMEKDPARRLTAAQATEMLERPQHPTPRPAATTPAPRPGSGQHPQYGMPGQGANPAARPLGQQPQPMRPAAVHPGRTSAPPPGYVVPMPYPPRNPYQVPQIRVGGWWMYLLPVGMLMFFGAISTASQTKVTAAESTYRLVHPVGPGVVGALGLAGIGWAAVFIVMFLLRAWRMPARVIGYIGVAFMIVGYWSYYSQQDRYTRNAAAHGRILHFSDHLGMLVFGAFCVGVVYTVTEIMTRRAYRRMAARYGR